MVFVQFFHFLPPFYVYIIACKYMFVKHLFSFMLTRTTVCDKINIRKGEISMLDVLKSKVMILFAVLVIGVVFVDCSFNNNLDEVQEPTNLVLNS